MSFGIIIDRKKRQRADKAAGKSWDTDKHQRNIVKAGKEINKMKNYGISMKDIHRQMEPEVQKELNKRKEEKAREANKEAGVLADKIAKQAAKEGLL